MDETPQIDFDVPPIPRRHRGPSLRVLMVVIGILSAALGWLVYRARVQRQAVAAIEAANGTVYYGLQSKDGRPIPPESIKLPAPKWLVSALGIDFFDHPVTVLPMGRIAGGARFDDDVAAQIGRFDRLEILDMMRCPRVTDAGLVHLRGLSRLKTLFLGEGVRGPGLANLSGLARLEQLRITGPPTDADLDALAGLRSLKILTLNSNRLTDAGLAHLAGLDALGALQTDQFPPTNHGAITSDGLTPLGRLARLGSLRLNSTRIDRLDPLTGLVRLHTLGLRDSLVDDAGLAPVASLVGLQTLDLSGTRVTDAGLVHLALLPLLTRLELSRTAISDAGLDRLAGLSALIELVVTETKVTPEGIAALEARRPGLKVNPVRPNRRTPPPR